VVGNVHFQFVVERSSVIKCRPYWYRWRLLYFGMWHCVVW